MGVSSQHYKTTGVCVAGFMSALTLMFFGIILRLSSRNLVWPPNYSFSGPRDNTEWAIREAAINDIAMGLFYIGGAILVVIAYLVMSANITRSVNIEQSNTERLAPPRL